MRVYTQRPDHNTGNYVPYALRTALVSFQKHMILTEIVCHTSPQHVDALIFKINPEYLLAFE